MIKAKNLYFHFRGKMHIFRDFSLEVPRGQIYGLLGANGTGKSTLLKLIAGTLTPTAGSMRLLDQESSQRNLTTLQSIAFVPEEFTMPNISVAQFERLRAPFYPTYDHALFIRALKEFGVEPDSRLSSLSMGERKKAYIAFAMACNTQLLLLDEPTNGLDITSKSVFRRLLAEWASPERTAIISTHQVKDVENLLDHITIIDKKGVVVDASTYDICQRLKFSIEPTKSHAIYAESTLGGYACIVKNSANQESHIDIELLFAAATAKRQEMKSILNPSTL